MAKKDATTYFREMLLQFIGKRDPLHAKTSSCVRNSLQGQYNILRGDDMKALRLPCLVGYWNPSPLVTHPVK
jgi:hypothetical protein